MEIGVTFIKDRKSKSVDDELAKRIITKAGQNGLHLVFGGTEIFGFAPLTIERSILDKGIQIFFRKY